MADKLAKLADLKAALQITSSGNDAWLTTLLAWATSLAEGADLAGRPLLRAAGIVEYPRIHSARNQSRYVYLARRPIESVASVTQLYHDANDADFDAADPFVEQTDYTVDGERGRLERRNGLFYACSRNLRVVYAGGFIDPDLSGEDLPEGAIQPPASLQLGLVRQAAKWFKTLKDSGFENVGAGNVKLDLVGGGAEPELVMACRTLRRFVV